MPPLRRSIAIAALGLALGATACGGGDPPPAEAPEAPRPGGDAAAVAALAERWYADADPAVCESMTEAMLELGWETGGAAGREACRASVGKAEPVADVLVREPALSGDEATVEVVYTLDGKRRVDRLTLVRRDGAWLVDRVEYAGAG